MLSQIFISSRGIRVGWRVLLFLLIFAPIVLIFPQLELLIIPIRNLLIAAQNEVRPIPVVLVEVLPWGVALLVALLAMSKLERRQITDYGWQPRNNRLWQHGLGGFAFGIAMVAAMFLLLWLEHAYSVNTLALTGSAALKYAGLWAVVCAGIAIVEEGVFRGYLQHALAGSFGFWPAAVLVSAAFGAIHLLSPGYVLTGVASAAAFGLLFSLCLWKTGDLWLSIGLHAGVDWAEFFLLPADNGYPASPHALHAMLRGPDWLTGSSIGPEASINGCVVFVIAFVLFGFLLKRTSGRFLGG